MHGVQTLLMLLLVVAALLLVLLPLLLALLCSRQAAVCAPALTRPSLPSSAGAAPHTASPLGAAAPAPLQSAW
jgi:hypothetical protein